MAFSEPLSGLVDNSTGTPAPRSFVRVAHSADSNDQSFRQLSPYDPLDNTTLHLLWRTSKLGVITAQYATRREVRLNGFSDFVTAVTKFNLPRSPAVLTMAQVRSLISTHGSFIKTSGALADTDLVMRLLAGEI